MVLDSSAVVERECNVRATSSGNLEEIKPLCLFLFLACLFRGVRAVTAALALWLSLGASIGLTMAQSAIEDSPQTRRFRWTVTGAMNAPRYKRAATLLPDGRVLVAGGTSDSSLSVVTELYDPATGVWTATGDLINPRDFHTATLLPNGKVLIAGDLFATSFLMCDFR